MMHAFCIITLPQRWHFSFSFIFLKYGISLPYERHSKYFSKIYVFLTFGYFLMFFIQHPWSSSTVLYIVISLLLLTYILWHGCSKICSIIHSLNHVWVSFNFFIIMDEVTKTFIFKFRKFFISVSYVPECGWWSLRSPLLVLKIIVKFFFMYFIDTVVTPQFPHSPSLPPSPFVTPTFFLLFLH